MRIIWQAHLEFLSLEYSFFRNDFSAIYEKVRNTPVRALRKKTITLEQVCRAIDLTAVFYLKPTLCLQRSAATACLLKKHGFPAELVIGVQHLPFLAHAWVELDGMVLNDKPYVTEIYSVITRC